mmetsp:Transcript_13257/g.35196  ORF Transcript_13257/g.35196 Transcript_13257/m.35196 type:complete len:206 (+) Transcript_13257:324-941(+)
MLPSGNLSVGARARKTRKGWCGTGSSTDVPASSPTRLSSRVLTARSAARMRRCTARACILRGMLVIVRTRCTASGTRTTSNQYSWRALWSANTVAESKTRSRLPSATRPRTRSTIRRWTTPRTRTFSSRTKTGRRIPNTWSNSNRTAIRHHTPQPTNRRIQTTAPTSSSPWRPRRSGGRQPKRNESAKPRPPRRRQSAKRQRRRR